MTNDQDPTRDTLGRAEGGTMDENQEQPGAPEQAINRGPGPNEVPTAMECFASAARMMRAFEMDDGLFQNPQRASLYLEASNRWLELGATLYNVAHSIDYGDDEEDGE